MLGTVLQTDIQRHTDRQTDRQTGWQGHTQCHRQTDKDRCEKFKVLHLEQSCVCVEINADISWKCAPETVGAGK